MGLVFQVAFVFLDRNWNFCCCFCICEFHRFENGVVPERTVDVVTALFLKEASLKEAERRQTPSLLPSVPSRPRLPPFLRPRLKETPWEFPASAFQNSRIHPSGEQRLNLLVI